MPTWEARVSRGTAPAERVDAELRYALVAPLLRDAALWVDLGCGTGVPAAAALGDAIAGVPTLLVDQAPEALTEAARELPAETQALEVDLSTPAGTQKVAEAIAARTVTGPVVVTCLDVLHQIAQFGAVLELLINLGEQPSTTVVLSVPDDAAGGLDDPHRASAWSAGAAEELRRLLPSGALSLRQVTVRGSVIAPADGGQEALLGNVAVPSDPTPTHHLLAFGAAADRLTPVSLARVADVEGERADARRRESDLAYLEARLAELEAPAG